MLDRWRTSRLSIPSADMIDAWLGKYSNPKVDYNLTYEDVEFSQSGEYVLRGWYAG